MSTPATSQDKATQFGQYIGLLLVALFVAACWVLVAILLTPLGGDKELAVMTMRARMYLIVFGTALDTLVSGIGAWAIAQGQTIRARYGWRQ